jgi:hypothetical protein
MADNSWTIIIQNPGGYCPSYFKNSYPSYGNVNQFSAMNNIDLTDPNIWTQGPLMVYLDNGSQASSTSTLIKGMLRLSLSDASTYATGGNKLYRLSSGAVSNTGGFPYTIDHGSYTGESGEDVVYWRSEIYVPYNHSGGGDILKLKPNSPDFDVDWGSTYPKNAGSLQNAPHQVINGGDDDVYITNGPYIARLYWGTDGSPYLDTTALDFWQNSQTSSITWNANRILIALNRPNVSGAYANQSGIYTWNGVSSSWEGDPIEINGRIGALFTKNGITFCWWQESGQSNVYNFGYVTDKTNVIKQFQGTLPLYYQVGEFKGFISWVSDGLVYLWGPADSESPTKAFQYVETVHSTSGGIGTPFGELLVASNSGSNYAIEKPSTTQYDQDSSFKTIAFNKDSSGKSLSGPGYKSEIDIIQVEIEPQSEGAYCQSTLTYDKAVKSQSLWTIDAESSSPTLRNMGHKFPVIEDFRLDFDFMTASPSVPTKFRSIFIKGHFIQNN